ncbi:MAG: hypothetical protein WC201_00055 [Bacilli bacterium]
MNKFTKNAIFVLSSIFMVGTVAVAGLNGFDYKLISTEAESPSYSLVLDGSNAASGLTDSFGTVASYSPSRYVDWTINGGKRAEGGHVQLEQSTGANGYLANASPINGVISITATFEGNLTLLASPNQNGNIADYATVTELTSGTAFTKNMVSSMFAFASGTSSPVISSISITYVCQSFTTTPYVVEDGEGKTSAEVKASYTGTYYTSSWTASSNGIANTSKDVSSTGGNQSVYLRYNDNSCAFRHTKSISFPERTLYNAFSIQMKGNSIATGVTVRLNSSTSGVYADYKIAQVSKAWTEYTIPFASSDWQLNYDGNIVTFAQALQYAGETLGVATVEQLVVKLFDQFEFIEKATTSTGKFLGVEIDNAEFINVDASTTSVTNLDVLEGTYAAYASNNLVEATLNADLSASIKVTQKTTVAYNILGSWVYVEAENKVTITTEMGHYEATVDGYGRSLVYSSADGDLAALVTGLNLYKRKILDGFNDADTAAIQSRWNVRYDSGSGWATATSADRLIADTMNIFEDIGSARAKSWSGGKYGYRLIDLVGSAVLGNDIHGFSFRILNNSGVSFVNPKLHAYDLLNTTATNLTVNAATSITSDGNWCEVSTTFTNIDWQACTGLQLYLEASVSTFYFYMDCVQVW